MTGASDAGDEGGVGDEDDAGDEGGVGDEATDVPADAPAFECERCGRPFARERYRALHRGRAHPSALTAAEREAYEDALADERADIRRFRLVALGVLVLAYFGFLFAYALVT
ncbi:MAG: C2H2-type zinc finger protein [Haloferacaceae archaeon]